MHNTFLAIEEGDKHRSVAENFQDRIPKGTQIVIEPETLGICLPVAGLQKEALSCGGHLGPMHFSF